jgi:hypothetical protein
MHDSDKRTGIFHSEARAIFKKPIRPHSRFACYFILRLIWFNTFYSTLGSCTDSNCGKYSHNVFAPKFVSVTIGNEVADLSLRQIATLCSYRADLKLIELYKLMQGCVCSSAPKTQICIMLFMVFMQGFPSFSTCAREASIARFFELEWIHWLLLGNTMVQAHLNTYWDEFRGKRRKGFIQCMV